MAVSTSYRLPGVYSNETTGPFVNITNGGNATVALIGPALGYSVASQQATMSGVEPVALEEFNVISGGVSIKSRTPGIAPFVNGVDFIEYTDLDGTTYVKRRMQSLSLAKATVTNREKTFYTAEPEFSIMVDAAGGDIDGYPVCGSVRIVDTEDGRTNNEYELIEGFDYVIDYKTGMLGAVAGGRLADASTNGHVLRISFEWVTAEPIELVGEAAFKLDHYCIAENGLGESSIRIVSCAYSDDNTVYEWGDTPGAPDGYLENIDFVVDYQTGRITRTPSSRIPSFDAGQKNYMYAEFAYDAIRDGENVVIDYMHQGEGYGEAAIVSSYVEAAKIFGSAWDAETGDVVSPLSLAAYLAFQNGMSFCYMVAVKADVTSETIYDDVTSEISVKANIRYSAKSWEDAFNILTTIDNIDIVVPITADDGNFALGRQHLATMKANQDERVMIVGLDGTDSQLSIMELISRANNLNDRDIWMVGPSTVRFRNPIRNTVDVIPGYYMAAAVAGYNSSVPQYTPLTRKVLSGFYSANEYATKLNKTSACANGVMYVDEVNGQLRVLHGTSTDVQSVITRETNVTLTKYFIIKRLRKMFETGYIGEIITDETVLSIHAVMFSALTGLVEGNYMYSFSDLGVSIDPNLPTQVNITFMYVPTYGMNYIQISFAIDTTSGMVDTEVY